MDKTVLKEIKFVSLGMVIMCALMNSVFLVIGKWDYHVLLSTILMGGIMILHFVLLCLTIQKVVNYENREDAQKLMKVSQMSRLLMIGVVLAIGIVLSEKGSLYVFSFWALLPPLFFNRITIMIRGAMIKKEDSNAEIPDDSEGSEEEN